MLSRLFSRKRSFPKHLAILLTNPRSGSTWLFDALRCHPLIDVHPTAEVFTYFGMSGRRYPRDLAGNIENAQQVEVRPNEWESLPQFDLPPDVLNLPTETNQYALEKCHPHFFKHDVSGFVQKLHALNESTTVRLIYQVRDPQESFISFLRYQARNPSWNPHIKPDALPAHMRRIYESIAACAIAYPGIIIRYEQLSTDFDATLNRIFGYLWDNPDTTSPQLIQAINRATGRDQRTVTPFLGAHTTNVEQDKSAHAAFFEQNAAEIAACYNAYLALIGTG